MIRWMDAYWAGLGVKEADVQVKAFSSRNMPLTGVSPRELLNACIPYLVILTLSILSRKVVKFNTPEIL